MNIDALDKAILSALVRDGRLSQVDLSEQVPLSPTAVARRIKALEEAGVIEGYQARVNRQALGIHMTIFVEIALKSQNEELLASFEKAAAAAEKKRLAACARKGVEEKDCPALEAANG